MYASRMKDFLGAILRSSDINDVFNSLNNIIIDPATDRDIYWLKTTMQQYLPVTDHSERDIIRRAWGFTDTAFDVGDLTCRR